MANQFFFKEWIQPSRLPIENIGIIFCTSTQSAVGRENEKFADCEIVDGASAVQAALMKNGYHAELVELDLERIGDLYRYDWIFNLTETIYGYPLADFEIALKLEAFNINFTGSGSKTLKTCLNKAATKCELLLNGIGTPAFEVFQPGKPIRNYLGYPLFVKPVNEDGSFGITDNSIVNNDAELKQQVGKVHSLYKQAALVEQYIHGRDITASVIGNRAQAIALPLSEITYPEQFSPKFQTFNGKWVSDSLDYQVAKSQCPCDVSPQLESQIKDIALRAYHTLGCRDYARVDFRLQGETPFVLEVNPNPCINPDDSGFIRSSQAAGYSYVDMVTKILEDSVLDRLQIPRAVLEREFV